MKLRGHHLICLHFFSGQGYGPDFVAFLSGLLERAEAGEAIEVAAGADDLCRECPYLSGGGCTYAEGFEEEIRAMDRTALELLSLTPGQRVTWDQLEAFLPEIMAQWAAHYCQACDWRPACAQDEFWRQLSGLEPIAFPISDSLDLHTFNPKELPALLTDYIEAALSAGFGQVRIIHGKGKGVLRTRVKEILARHPKVHTIKDAPPEAGGWGAVLVSLRKK